MGQISEMTLAVLDRALVASDAGRVTGEQERPDLEVPDRARRRGQQGGRGQDQSVMMTRRAWSSG